MPILEVKNLNVSYGGVKVLDDINFNLERGETLAIVGPNGAGKTILLKSLLAQIKYEGQIKWAKGLEISYVPQRMDIETDIPIKVMEFFELRGKNIGRDKVLQALKTVELDESILNKGLGEISVGQRQRILVAWAVLGNPDVLLFDEPTADIDIAGQESIYKLIHYLHHQLGLTIILVSHDLNVVYKYAHKVICLNRQRLCFGVPKEVLSTEQLLKLYGGDKAFYQHEHH